MKPPDVVIGILPEMHAKVVSDLDKARVAESAALKEAERLTGATKVAGDRAAGAEARPLLWYRGCDLVSVRVV